MVGIKHQNIGIVYDVVKHPPTIVMEWINGKSLDQTWEKGKDSQFFKFSDWVIQLANALLYLHTKEQQIIYRDIKPENIIVRDDGEPILIDFGIARAVTAVGTIIPYDKHGNALSFAGTPNYAAPEQFTNAKSITDRADIYALGVVLYEALSLLVSASLQVFPQSPHGENPPDSRIPALLWQLLRAMLSVYPCDRPDAQQLCQELKCCLQGLEK